MNRKIFPQLRGTLRNLVVNFHYRKNKLEALTKKKRWGAGERLNPPKVWPIGGDISKCYRFSTLLLSSSTLTGTQAHRQADSHPQMPQRCRCISILPTGIKPRITTTCIFPSHSGASLYKHRITWTAEPEGLLD